MTADRARVKHDAHRGPVHARTHARRTPSRTAACASSPVIPAHDKEAQIGHRRRLARRPEPIVCRDTAASGRRLHGKCLAERNRGDVPRPHPPRSLRLAELAFALLRLGHRVLSPSACTLETEVMTSWSALWTQRPGWKRGAVENCVQYGLSPARGGSGAGSHVDVRAGARLFPASLPPQGGRAPAHPQELVNTQAEEKPMYQKTTRPRLRERPADWRERPFAGSGERPCCGFRRGRGSRISNRDTLSRDLGLGRRNPARLPRPRLRPRPVAGAHTRRSGRRSARDRVPAELDPRYQGQGICGRLLRQLIGVAAERGQPLVLEVLAVTTRVRPAARIPRNRPPRTENPPGP